MSLFQLSAYVAGWNAANGGDKPAPPSDEEFDAMLAASDALDARGDYRG